MFDASEVLILYLRIYPAKMSGENVMFPTERAQKKKLSPQQPPARMPCAHGQLLVHDFQYSFIP